MRTWMLALVVLASGCGVSSREARAIQPNPARAVTSAEEVRASVPLYIHQRDMHLPRDYQLRSFAQFFVVTRDRLRFHVGIVRWDETEAETKNWKVWLEDDSGRRIEPEGREVARVSRIAVAWGLYPYSPINSSWCPEPPCLSRLVPGYEVFAGEADYVFKEAGLLAPERKMLSLVLQRGSLQYRYTWRFDGQTMVQHYGRTKVDNELGIIVVPGPHTEVASTRYESESW